MKWVVLSGTVATVTALLAVFDSLSGTASSVNAALCWAATAAFVISLLAWLIRGR